MFLLEKNPGSIGCCMGVIQLTLQHKRRFEKNLIKLLYSAEHSSLSDEIMKLKVVRYFYN